MKNTSTLLLVIIMVCMAVGAFAQNTDTTGFIGFKNPGKILDRVNVIKTSPVPFIVGQIPYCGEFRLTYERVLAEHHSITVGGSLNYPGALMLVLQATDTTGQFKAKDYSIIGGRFTLGYRYYPFTKRRQAPKGFFVGPYASYNVAVIKLKGGNGSSEGINFFNVCAILGYQIVKKNGFSFEFFGGIGYKNNFVKEYNAHYGTTTTSSFPSFIAVPSPTGGVLKGVDHLKFALQINMGYAF